MRFAGSSRVGRARPERVALLDVYPLPIGLGPKPATPLSSPGSQPPYACSNEIGMTLKGPARVGVLPRPALPVFHVRLPVTRICFSELPTPNAATQCVARFASPG